MIRSLRLTLSLSVALTAILADTTFATTIADQNPEPPQLEQIEPSPLCYLQTSDGKVWDLNQLCQQQPQDTTARFTPQIKSPYNASTIKKYDDDLYGEGN